MKIGILIPTTSNQRTWDKPEDSYLYNLTLSTFENTYNTEHEYVFYIGIDKGDKLFDKSSTQQFFSNYIKKNMYNCTIQFIYIQNVKKGHLSKMWNILFKIAYDDKCNYFFQCGDDIMFKTNNWINDCIKTLQSNNNIGVTGPINNNCRILTQTFVHRTHMDIFTFYFPEDIINWCIDDWINLVYKELHYFPLYNHYCSNEGGSPRYLINFKHTTQDIKTQVSAYKDFLNLKKTLNIIVLREKSKLINYNKGN
jgi:hypothetical protein